MTIVIRKYKMITPNDHEKKINNHNYQLNKHHQCMNNEIHANMQIDMQEQLKIPNEQTKP